MRKRQHAGPSTKVALDLGSTFVKMLAASDDGGRLKLAGFGMKRLAGHSAEDKVRAIRELAAESHIAVKDLAISVCGPAVQVRFISMPKMKEDELAGATKFEAEKFMPFNIDECVVDYHILRRNEHENKLDLILVAAKKDFVEGKISIVEEAGFSVRMVDVDSLAMTNAFLKNLPPSGNEKTVALMDMGSSASNLSILNGGNLCFVRTITMAGNDFDEAISRGLGVDTSSARELKTKPDAKAGEIAGIVKSAANALIDEIKLSFGYYENLYGGAVDEIYLSGGSSALIGMGEALGEAFGTKPIAWDPVNFMDVSGVDAASLETAKRYLAVASGLALR
jgi:type IV pilus assembly protein PilM